MTAICDGSNPSRAVLKDNYYEQFLTIRGIKMSLIKVNKNKNPYHIIGEYIEKHTTYVDDIIAVISLDGNIINELFLSEITTESNFIWQRDWWEGEENIELVDFFFVSDACKRCDNNDLISRQQTIDAVHKSYDTILDFKSDGRTVADSVEDIINTLPSAQPEIIRCKDCTHYDGEWCFENRHYLKNYDFCSRAERREVTE